MRVLIVSFYFPPAGGGGVQRVLKLCRHLPELGVASAERKDLKTQADYDALFAEYERKSLPQQDDALKKISGWIQREGYRVALTCYEAEPCQCHRHCVAEALERLGGAAVAPPAAGRRQWTWAPRSSSAAGARSEPS